MRLQMKHHCSRGIKRFGDYESAGWCADLKRLFLVRGDLQKKLSGVNFSVNNLLLFSNFLHRQRLKSSQVSQHHFDYRLTAVTL